MPRMTRKNLLTLALAAPVILFAGFMAAVALTPLPAPNLPEATEILASDGTPITRLFRENRVEVPVVEMPEHLLNAIVAVEDDRFYTHHGLDFTGIARALLRNIKAGRTVEGGSTLTQQLAKNLYLSQERTLTRKLKEAILTIKLEYTYSKKEILGMYWNTIYLGSGTYGVEVASQTYFGKSARDLTLSEAALLAGLPRSPEYYSPRSEQPEASVQRRNLVLDKMLDQGMITPQAAAAAKAEPLRLASLQQTPTGTAPFFVDYVLRELKERFPEVASHLYQTGYQIHTTLDPKVQKAAEEAVLAEAPPGTPSDDGTVQPQLALVSMDPTTGHIRAIIGGREQRVDRNRVLELHQPGSAFKPFVYATALETRQYTTVSPQMDAPAEFPGATTGEPWRPKNYGNRYSNKPVGMREALRRSLNVVTAHWMDTLKPGPVINLARRMGIESKLPEDLTIGLGSAEVTPLELTRAYAPLANGGFAVKPLAILRITDRNGSVIAEQRSERTRALDPGTAFIVTDMLRSVTRPGGTAGVVSGYMAGRPVAGKTGTSDLSRDAWFVGYTPDLVTSVWAGTDDNRETNLEGGGAPAKIWANFASRALSGRPHRNWEPPSGVTVVEICTLTGFRPNASCPKAKEWFLAGTEPTQIDPTVHWDELLPSLPGVPWAPPGSLPPGQETPEEEEERTPEQPEPATPFVPPILRPFLPEPALPPPEAAP